MKSLLVEPSLREKCQYLELFWSVFSPNTVNFYAVRGANNCKKEKRFVALSYLADYFVKKENKTFTQKFPELVQLKAFSSHLHVLLIFPCLKNCISSSS